MAISRPTITSSRSTIHTPISVLPRFVPTPGTDEPAEVGQAAALEVEHADCSVGAGGVLLDQRVPAQAVRALQFIASVQVLLLLHAPECIERRDSGGHG